MKVLVLAAGRSTRMAPVGDKNFLEFCGKPLLQWQLEMISEAFGGEAEVIVVGGAHNLERIKGLAEGAAEVGKGVSVVEQVDLDAGMCGAVLAAKDVIAGSAVLIFSSNDVVDKEAFELVREAEGASSYILGKRVEKYFPGGYLETNSEGMISGIVEKPGEGNEPSDLVNLVVHLHNDSAKLIEHLEAVSSAKDDMYEVALDNMIKEGVQMKAVGYDGFWQPIKFPWHVMKVWRHLFQKDFAGRKAAAAVDAIVKDSAVLNGEVIVESGAKILDGAVVNGPCYIGAGAVVATGSLVRESNVGAGCVIGFSTEVARSFLGRDVWTHSNYLGDSVIGNNVSFGAGTVTGNLRLDELEIAGSGGSKLGLICGDNVRAGINVSFMPGIRVGSGSFVGAGIVLAEDLPEKSFARGKWELKISENKCDISSADRSDFKKKFDE